MSNKYHAHTKARHKCSPRCPFYNHNAAGAQAEQRTPLEARSVPLPNRRELCFCDHAGSEHIHTSLSGSPPYAGVCRADDCGCKQFRKRHNHPSNRVCSPRCPGYGRGRTKAAQTREKPALDYIDPNGGHVFFSTAKGLELRRGGENSVHNHGIEEACDCACPVWVAWNEGKGVGLYPLVSPVHIGRTFPRPAPLVPVPPGARHHVEQIESTLARLVESKRLPEQEGTELKVAFEWVLALVAGRPPWVVGSSPEGKPVPLAGGEAEDLGRLMSSVRHALGVVLGTYRKAPRGAADSAAQRDVAEAFQKVNEWYRWSRG